MFFWKKVCMFLLGGLCLCSCFVTTEKPFAAEEEEIFVPSTVPAPEFSAEGGFYEAGFKLTITAPEGTKVYYTLDGSEPSVQSRMYIDPIQIDDCQSRKGAQLLEATVVRAVSVAADGEIGDVQTHTYFVARGMKDWYQVPVISLAVDPISLYDEEIGIMLNPEGRGREWERPAHFEYFLPDGARELSLNVGIRIQGGYSRRFDIKSFRLYARSEYDTQKSFKYDFFSGDMIPAVEKNGEGKNIEKFKRLLLRAGGNESDAWETTMFRDILAQSLMADTLLDVQAYQPAITYLNGEFYGILNIRERTDDRYLSSHYNCSETDVAIYGFEYNKDSEGNVILPPEGEPVFEVVMESGVEEEKGFFDEAYTFVTTQDMSDATNYAKAQEYFDIRNFIDYLCLQLYSGNNDWPHNNCEAWRYVGEPSKEYGLDGKIRWLVFDVDFAFGLYGHSVSENVLVSMAEDQEWEQPYRDVLTCLFRAFLQNEGFKEQFRKRFTELLDTSFAPENVLPKIDMLEKIYEPLAEELYLKSDKRHSYKENVNEVRLYVSERVDVLKKSLEWVLDAEKRNAVLDAKTLRRNRRILLAAVIVLLAGGILFVRYKKRDNFCEK